MRRSMVSILVSRVFFLMIFTQQSIRLHHQSFFLNSYVWLKAFQQKRKKSLNYWRMSSAVVSRDCRGAMSPIQCLLALFDGKYLSVISSPINGFVWGAWEVLQVRVPEFFLSLRQFVAKDLRDTLTIPWLRDAVSARYGVLTLFWYYSDKSVCCWRSMAFITLLRGRDEQNFSAICSPYLPS